MGDRIYPTKEVSEHLDVKPSTVRKYALLLEEGGYRFIRNKRNERLYVETDLRYFKQLKQLIDSGDVTLKEAANTVATRFIESPDADRFNSAHNDDIEEEEPENAAAGIGEYGAKIEELLTYINKQDERLDQQERFNRELLDRLDQQTRYIEDSLNKRDERLMNAFRERLDNNKEETVKQIAAANEEREERKGLFARLFGK